MHSPHPYALAASARSRIHTQDLGLMDGVNEEIAAMIDGALSDSSAEAPNRWNPAVEADALTSGEITAQSWGFDVERINREHALLLMGSKAVVVNEQTDGPIKDRVRFFSREAFNAWLANR